MLKLRTKDADFEAQFSSFIKIKREKSEDVNASVSKILEAVKSRGDDALVEFTKSYDDFDINPAKMRIAEDDIDIAVKSCSASEIEALNLAADRIKDYHKKQMPEDLQYIDAMGVTLGYRWSPVNSVGIYVPGGMGAYPSSVLMNAIPAKIAGVKRLVMVVPTPKGNINSLVLAAAKIAGVDDIFRIGGAQALAALAYGTDSVPAVDKIVGPGNVYVATAKKQVFGVVGIDMFAGPSEVLVVADAENDPNWIASDLLAQAEHDASAQAILITDDEGFANSVDIRLQEIAKNLSRSDTALSSWKNFGAIIIVDDVNQSVALIDRISPEHLQLAVESPESISKEISNAGAIFLGRFTPEAMGDYLAGPSHVLPTDGTARFSSGLGVADFMKRSSIIGCDRDSLSKLGPHAAILAEAEGLQAHALSITSRLDKKK